jgi:hypothetical protein
MTEIRRRMEAAARTELCGGTTGPVWPGSSEQRKKGDLVLSSQFGFDLRHQCGVASSFCLPWVVAVSDGGELR